MRVLASAPRGLFPGRNFMTPDIESYFKLAKGYAELARGVGMYNEPIFGVTVRPDDLGDGKRSKMFHSRKAAMDYIEEMS
jgi:hypothetical protein